MSFTSTPPIPPAVVTFLRDGSHLFRALDSDAPCPTTHYQCPRGYCLPVYTLCNGLNDCPGREDEQDCDTFTCPGLYRCRASPMCVHFSHLCDNVTQCPQGDDELLCRVSCPENCSCHGYAFTCWDPYQVCPCLYV